METTKVNPILVAVLNAGIGHDYREIKGRYDTLLLRITTWQRLFASFQVWLAAQGERDELIEVMAICFAEKSHQHIVEGTAEMAGISKELEELQQRMSGINLQGGTA